MSESRVSRRRVIVTAAIMASAVLLATPRAYAFLGVGDTSDALLAEVVVNGVQQLATITETLATLRKSYEEVRKVASYAQDAYAIAASFQHFSVKRFGERLQSGLSDAYPDAAYYRDQMAYGRWATGGRLAPYIRYCMNGTLSKNAAGDIVFNSDKLCTSLRQEVGTSQVLVMLGQVFGSVPERERTTARGAEATVVDAEVAAQISAQTSQWNRAQRVKQMVEQMQADCAATSDGSGPSAACEAAAQRAQLEALAEHAETNRLLSEQARLLALQLAQKNADLKREITAEAERRAALGSAGRTLGAETIRVKAGGSEL